MKADLIFILDKSGSMASLRNDSIGGFNNFVEDQKKVPGYARLWLGLFSDGISCPVNGSDIQRVSPLTEKDYVPGGGTALLDAIGTAIDDHGARLRDMPASERPDKVIVTIMTDGEENSSWKFTKAQIAAKIKHQREVYNWEFIFLGANIDSFAEAGAIGIAQSTTSNFRATSAGIGAAYASAMTMNTTARTK